MSKDIKAVCSKCSWKSSDICRTCELRDVALERIQSKSKKTRRKKFFKRLDKRF